MPKVVLNTEKMNDENERFQQGKDRVRNFASEELKSSPENIFSEERLASLSLTKPADMPESLFRAAILGATLSRENMARMRETGNPPAYGSRKNFYQSVVVDGRTYGNARLQAEGIASARALVEKQLSDYRDPEKRAATEDRIIASFCDSYKMIGPGLTDTTGSMNRGDSAALVNIVQNLQKDKFGVELHKYLSDANLMHTDAYSAYEYNRNQKVRLAQEMEHNQREMSVESIRQYIACRLIEEAIDEDARTQNAYFRQSGEYNNINAGFQPQTKTDELFSHISEAVLKGFEHGKAPTDLLKKEGTWFQKEYPGSVIGSQVDNSNVTAESFLGYDTISVAHKVSTQENQLSYLVSNNRTSPLRRMLALAGSSQRAGSVPGKMKELYSSLRSYTGEIAAQYLLKENEGKDLDDFVRDAYQNVKLNGKTVSERMPEITESVESRIAEYEPGEYQKNQAAIDKREVKDVKMLIDNNASKEFTAFIKSYFRQSLLDQATMGAKSVSREIGKQAFLDELTEVDKAEFLQSKRGMMIFDADKKPRNIDYLNRLEAGQSFYIAGNNRGSMRRYTVSDQDTVVWDGQTITSRDFLPAYQNLHVMREGIHELHQALDNEDPFYLITGSSKYKNLKTSLKSLEDRMKSSKNPEDLSVTPEIIDQMKEIRQQAVDYLAGKGKFEELKETGTSRGRYLAVQQCVRGLTSMIEGAKGKDLTVPMGAYQGLRDTVQRWNDINADAAGKIGASIDRLEAVALDTVGNGNQIGSRQFAADLSRVGLAFTIQRACKKDSGYHRTAEMLESLGNDKYMSTVTDKVENNLPNSGRLNWKEIAEMAKNPSRMANLTKEAQRDVAREQKSRQNEPPKLNKSGSARQI